MKILKFCIPLLFFVAASCTSDAIPHFSLVMETTTGDTTIRYTLTDTSIMVQESSTLHGFAFSTSFEPIREAYNDTLIQISKMKSKSYDCKEQHALLVSKITFTNDSGTVDIDPNINHPKEIDAAVRIFNRYIPEKYRLQFIDMQQAIEPNNKLQL